ncbi:MAG: type I pullulanase [Tenericutes bacterium GWC2_34_14]|nr:MAG: type I pullulanase [Tenericutes bacterium GWA2_35_7]OHE29198.1 MAG: type I pullulanase [Tenericutes bacterium GWC2_34_14]OHE34281.1 MAG: type I pullulanase [Tenericutes bacterium GWE2_34_108]OHE35633.1 MAG: type I pullulanase [Tenericutes bacterium GWF1_35_14]OHE38848.1 MAG: type I pullulanase [Tenericutes bacterium GWF2_35_184]OHE43880.1 MAG: type I pullulanase [Tenericutes bacterium RIFOXYA2_FULL_36_32]OHE46319.1 MAG: type I pullulanase [Tenericutes bacterium RIFOXYB2_FULL_36_25]OH
MKKLLILAFMVPLIALMFSMVVRAAAVTDVYVHYYRYQNDYSDWNLWAWKSKPVSQDGASFTFSEDDTATSFNYGGVVSKITLEGDLAGTTELGFIVRKGDWLQKDIDNDRFITIPVDHTSSELHVYLVEGDAAVGYGMDDPDGPDKSPKIKQAYFNALNRIYFVSTEMLSVDNVNIYKDDILQTTDVKSVDGLTGYVVLNEDVDFSKAYEVEVTFSDNSTRRFEVTYDGIYDSVEFEDAFGYEGDDLGAHVVDNKTTFRLWAPVSSAVSLNLYTTGTTARYGGSDTPYQTIPMLKDVKGTYFVEVNESLHGVYYTFSVTNGSTTSEVIDPYAVSSGVNGQRGLVVDFNEINPEGFTYNDRPDNMSSYTDAIIYELHVRDLTMHSSWNGSEENRGKYLGLIERGTTYNGVTTGFDHIVELGVTHVQLLPFFDYGVVDETRVGEDGYNAFNWGYMPLNFNVLEGTYSNDPYDGLSRVVEMKQVIQAFHEEDIRINMDVVYNHTGLSADSNLNLIIPGYYHRKTESGAFSNGSGTGNETASERYMVRKFFVDSVLFWANEYNMSGFRFDLMTLHDIETMQQIADELHAIDPTIMVYGEPWMGGTSTLPASEQAGKANLYQIDGVGAFNDDLRDGVKGSVFARAEGAFIQGKFTDSFINRVRYGIAGGIAHPDVTGSLLSNQRIWHTEPTKTINYVTAHDNNTLYDKLYQTLEETGNTALIPAMMKQANAIVLLSQGVTFLHAGDEFMRSKPSATGDGFDHNSYQSPDSVNQMRWDYKSRDLEMEIFEYYKDLIAFRKNHPALRMTTSEDIIDNLEFVYKDVSGIMAYQLTSGDTGDSFEEMLIIHNANRKSTKIKLPTGGGWNLVGNQNQLTDETISTHLGGSRITIAANSSYVLVRDLTVDDYNPAPVIISITIGSIFIPGGGVFLVLYFLKKKKSIVA